MQERIATGVEEYGEGVVDGCRRGEPHALAHVFEREAPYLERVLGRILGPRGDLEDLLQSTLESAIRSFSGFRGEASVRTWLTRIAVRAALTHLRHPAQRRRATLEVIEGGAAQLEAREASPDHRAEGRARLQLLYEHLDRIDDKQRTAFVLFSVEGHSMEEVAALMGAGISATKSRVMWARRKLIARLSKDPRAQAWLSEYTGMEA